jgi:hypothetical protein
MTACTGILEKVQKPATADHKHQHESQYHKGLPHHQGCNSREASNSGDASKVLTTYCS